MSTWIEAVPAYGRDYKNQKEVKAAWKEGKDFQDAASGQYLSNTSDLTGIKVLIRYSKLTKVVGVN